MTKDKRVRFTLRLPQGLLKVYKNEALNKGVSLNALFVNIFGDWLKQHKQMNKNRQL